MKNTLAFVAFVLVVLVLLFTISGRRVPPPLIPDNDVHRGVTDVTVCISCHGLGKKAAVRKAHPPKTECFVCHKTKKGR
jgi:uncharacterized paraquat-inducible protein A